MSENIWVIAPTPRGQAFPATVELLALGRELADEVNERLCAVCWGHEFQQEQLCFSRADEVLYIEHPRLANATPEICAGVLEALARTKSPRCILIPFANETWELLGTLPERLGAPVANFCTDVRVADGGLEARCLLYGGKVEAWTRATATPAVFGILAGARTVHTIPPGPAPRVERFVPSLPGTSRQRLCRFVDPETGDIDVSKQQCLVSVGRGIKSKANIGIAEQLAEALGGTVCGSRPIIDHGWLPSWRQVGRSGAHVHPSVYLAAGVSGTPEHVEGMRQSRVVIAINSDPEAPIFNVAHYGVVGDAATTMRALVERLRMDRGAGQPA